MLRASLARRFIVFSSLLILATSLSLSLFTLAREENEEHARIQRRGISLARNLAHNAELGVLTRNESLLTGLAAGLLQEDDIRSVRVTDVDGILLSASQADHTPDRLTHLGASQRRSVGSWQATLTPMTDGNSKRVQAYEVSFPIFTRRQARHDEELFLLEAEADGGTLERIGEAHVIVSLASMYRELAEIRTVLGVLTSLVIAIALLLTVLMARRIVRPLQALAAATREIAEGRPAEVAVGTSKDEIGLLAQSFNRMTAELARSRQKLERYNASLEQEVRTRTQELEAAQSQLVQAEKMSAVGLLVSGVAHELNNPLAGVIGFSQLLLRSSTDAKIRRKLEVIDRDAQRCKRIVQNLQTFAREHKPQMEYLCINGILEQTLELRSYQLRVDDIEVITDFEDELPRTMVDFHQLQRVFLNVIINAHQSIADQGRGGRLRITTRTVDGELAIRFHDSGPGIAEAHLGRLFDPFFTTKEVGHGTGLGLSICYGIVQEHRGLLTAGNHPEGGALFTVRLPIRQPQLSDETVDPAHVECRPSTGTRKSILVVDDEAAIIEILAEVFNEDGHRVDSAVNGEMAWRKIQQDSYDVIISDMRMPGMSGQELYHKVREWDADLSRRIIFSTGDVLTSETHDFLEGSGNSYLQKPFELNAIRQVVNELLSGNRR